MRKTLLAALLATFALAAPASAQNYPSRPITVVVPFSAGGPTDAMARILGERMKASLGEAILIENTTGAGGSIGVGRVAHATPDGYTISIGHLGTHVANGAIYKLNYDLVADLEPIALLPSNPMVIVSKNAVPAKTLKELIEWLKSRPEPAAAGTAGAGSGSHIAGLAFENSTGIKLQYVPYRGTGPALNDLVGGQIDIIVDQLSNSINQIRAGTIRARPARSRNRSRQAPRPPQPAGADTYAATIETRRPFTTTTFFTVLPARCDCTATSASASRSSSASEVSGAAVIRPRTLPLI